MKRINALKPKTGTWETVGGVFTPGGDPLYRCPFCRSKESEHVHGVESPKSYDFCPKCGEKLKY